EPVSDPGWHAGALAEAAACERVASDPVPRVMADERITGGAYTVREQAREPFSAFVRGRLGVRELERVAPGLSAQRTGQIVHDALQRLFGSHPTSAELGAMGAAQRRARIAASVLAAVAPHERHADAVLRRLLALERARVETLLEHFLAAEAARRPFAVQSVETELPFVAHGVALELRVDRIDRLPDGSLLVLDYKTGEEQPLVDRDGEPADLQLVVYAAALAEPVSGLVLVHLGGSQVRYRGIGSGIDWNPLEPADWDARLARWKRRVDRLLEAF